MDVAAPAAADLQVVGRREHPVGKGAHGLNRHVHLGQLRLHHLELRDLFAELLARLRVFQRQFEGPLSDTEAQRGDHRALQVQTAHHHGHAAILAADQVLHRHAAVGEGQFGGLAVVMSGLDLERAMIAPLCLGIAERALELAREYAQSREQFGRKIAEFQMIQAKLAEMYVAVETMRTFTYRVLAAANDLDVGGGGRGHIHALTAASVMYASESMSRVLAEAVQIHGGNGYIWESEVNRLFRATKLLEIGAGTTEVRKLIISGELLGRVS